MSKYSKLKNFLKNTPSHISKVVLSFSEINMILKETRNNNELPPSAKYPQFWENQVDVKKRPQAKAWHDAGFSVSEKNLTAEWIEFTKI